MTKDEYETLSFIVHSSIGIHLKLSKKNWIEIKLSQRLKELSFHDFSQYLRFIQVNLDELKKMLNLVSINETSFFREIEHFKFLEEFLIKHNQFEKVRILSGASSIGAEAYSIAMVLESFKTSWEVVGTDINDENIEIAKKALYPLAFSNKIPDNYLKMYCLKGKNYYKEQFIINRDILKNVYFYRANLINFSNDFGMFDIIFLRNVLIYFTEETVKKVVLSILRNLKKGGFLIVSQTEYLSTLHFPSLKKVQNSIFQKIK
jgi:chemotaxis protein methyltransferase CheR